MAEKEFAGDLLIFVEGYEQKDFRCIEINSTDDFFWSTGWAVGDNSRGRYCSRQATDKIRKFREFDEAVRYIEARRRKRPKEKFFLVYLLDNTWTRVSSMDEILALDAAAVKVKPEPSERSRQRDILLGLGHSMAMANRLVFYLEEVREEGEAVANARLSRATLFRYGKLLKEAGFLP